MNTGEPKWRFRRLFIYVLAALSVYELHTLQIAEDTVVNQTLAYGWFTLLSVMTVAYTGFATVQDVIAIWRTGSATPYIAKGKFNDKIDE